MYQGTIQEFIWSGDLLKKRSWFFKQSNTDLDVSDMKDAGEFVAYNRAWAYIKKIDLTNESHINSINLYANKKLDKALQSGIDFFIQTEQYERCAHLQKILNCLSE